MNKLIDYILDFFERVKRRFSKKEETKEEPITITKPKPKVGDVLVNRKTGEEGEVVEVLGKGILIHSEDRDSNFLDDQKLYNIVLLEEYFSSDSKWELKK